MRSFIFVSELGEVTPMLKAARSADEGVEAALASEVISLRSNSNYGQALASFARGHLGAVTRRTTVLIIGDGRSNHNAPQRWALEDVTRKARRVVWVCTEPRSSWGTGDSLMLEYQGAVSQVVVVESLQDLSRLASKLVPG